LEEWTCRDQRMIGLAKHVGNNGVSEFSTVVQKSEGK